MPVRGSLSIGAEWPGHKENNPSSYKGNGTCVAPLITLFAILFHANVDWDPPRSVIASPRFHRGNGTPAMGHMGVPKIHAVGPELGFK